MVRVCFVCLGNICRSPTAEGVMRHLVRSMGLEASIEIDSAGTAAYHAGEPPDRRSRAAAARRGIEIGGRARQFRSSDWDHFEYVLAMDRENFDDLRDGAPPGKASGKLYLFREFDATAPKYASVPDPYYGGDQGFEDVLDMCDRACRGLIDHIRREHGL